MVYWGDNGTTHTEETMTATPRYDKLLTNGRGGKISPKTEKYKPFEWMAQLADKPVESWPKLRVRQGER